MSTNHVSVPVGSYVGPPTPPAADAEPCSHSDSDPDHPAQEPVFVMHTMDDDRRRRDPAAVRLPIVPPPRNPVANWERQAAARTERLQYHMLLPQVVICVWILVSGSTMIYLAAVNPDKVPDLNFTAWHVVLSALVMLLSLLSLLLSHLGVNVYD